MPTFRVLPLLPGESREKLFTSKTAPLAAAVVGFEADTQEAGLATIRARSAGTRRGLTLREEDEAMRRVKIKAFNPETEELEDGEIQVPIWQWTPQQWAVFLAALAAFIAAVVNVITGNPAGIPFAG